ncbi:uncharacterized protein LOC113547613 [Pangasianodon hypophthalmus]|uniref:uncharacterized protein LOC113547613 n=1 Tax=Pangasianodon hypophthalmus TaxID=310915 RepID=UPI0023082C08|nr:uncharacterized protein LOC113547613 [Pangasianodon hypophthalmus]
MRTHILSPVTAFLLWASCSSFPPTYCTVVCPNHGPSAPESPVLESLECRNDYLTHIRCSWTEVPGLPLSLFHLDPDEHRVSACVPVSTGPPTAHNASGQKRSQCRYNTSLFAIGFDDVFFFHTPHAQGLSGTFNLTQHGNITEDWTHIWLVSKLSTPAGTQSMTFNLRASHRISVELREDDRRSLNMMQKRRIDNGLNNISSTGAPPGPFNLQCVYDGEREVKCKWQMMRELAQYVVYDLSYRTRLNATSELCCAGLDGHDDDDDDDATMRFSCSFSVPEAETLLLALRPESRTKVFQAHRRIEPAAPADMRVELIGDDWVLNWTLPKYRTVPINSELRYWNINSPELAETLSLPPGVSVCVMAEGSLRSSSRYLAQVRCRVSPRRGRGSRYAGYPSDWTKPVYWTTRPAPASASAWVYFLLSASVSVALILMYFILLAFHRRLRVWDASLPSPFQSKLMDAVCQVHAEGLPFYTEMGDLCLSRVCVLENIQLNLHTIDQEHDDVTQLHAAYCNGPNHYASQEGSAVPDFTTQMWHCPSFPACSSEHTGFEVLFCDGRFAHLASASHNALQPCSEGYQWNPVSSRDSSSPDV